MRCFFLLLALTFSFQWAHAQCMEDCVWPGDLNENGVANNLDVLAIGFANGQTGPPRVDPSVDWEPLEADAWAGSLPVLGTNFKHIDADGNGVIDEQDRLPISINYNQTNDNFAGFLGDDIAGDDLFLVPVEAVATPGGSLLFDVHLGTDTNPINNLYGIGFQIDLDTQYVQDVNVDFTDTWVGQADEILVYDKYIDEIDHAGIAITRLDGTPTSGFGPIARVEIVITDVVLGIMVDTTACLPFQVRFKNVLGIDENENDLMITNRNDSLTLKHSSQLVNTAELLDDPLAYRVYPNPTSDQLIIENNNSTGAAIILYNQLGVAVYQNRIVDPTTRLSLKDFPEGLYFLEIRGQRHKRVLKVLRQ